MHISPEAQSIWDMSLSMRIAAIFAGKICLWFQWVLQEARKITGTILPPALFAKPLINSSMPPGSVCH
jgi:hypothetical protein